MKTVNFMKVMLVATSLIMLNTNVSASGGSGGGGGDSGGGSGGGDSSSSSSSSSSTTKVEDNSVSSGGSSSSGADDNLPRHSGLDDNSGTGAKLRGDGTVDDNSATGDIRREDRRENLSGSGLIDDRRRNRGSERAIGNFLRSNIEDKVKNFSDDRILQVLEKTLKLEDRVASMNLSQARKQSVLDQLIEFEDILKGHLDDPTILQHR